MKRQGSAHDFRIHSFHEARLSCWIFARPGPHSGAQSSHLGLWGRGGNFQAQGANQTSAAACCHSNPAIRCSSLASARLWGLGPGVSKPGFRRRGFHATRRPENAKGGGEKKRGGQNLTRRPPTENGFRPPSPQYVLPPPPYAISLSKSLRNSQNFPQLTSSETVFGGSRKMVFDGPSSRGFAFRYVLPPPLALPRPGRPIAWHETSHQVAQRTSKSASATARAHSARHGQKPTIRRTQEGCGGLGGENPANARPIFQQQFPCRKVPKPWQG